MTLLKARETQTDVLSPLFITEGQGTAIFNQAMLMPDGEFYLGVFSDKWKVHFSTLAPTSEQVGGVREVTEDQQTTGQLAQKYTLVGFYEDAVSIVIPGGQIRSLVIGPPPQKISRRIFNLDQWCLNWGQGGT